jgi:hypothetical protein
MADNAGYYSTSLNSTANPQDYSNLRGTWGPASMDARHSFVTSSNYELPFGRGKSLFAQASRPVNALIGAWRLSGVLTLRTGMPLTIVETPDTTNTGSVAPRPNLVSNPILGSAATPNRWFDTSAFVRQAPNTWGNSGNGVARMPGVRNLDLALEKQIPFIEAKHLEFRAEVFNLTNTPLFSGVSNTLGASNFGTITTAQASREIQLGLKFYF